jgi:regulator of sigma E protease
MDFTQIPFYILVGFTWLSMLMILVAAHELGHYLFARLFGMGAEEFSVGMFGRKPLLVLGRRRYILPLKPTDDPDLRGEASPLEGGAPIEPAELVDTPDGRYLKETTVFTIRPWPLGGFVRIKGMVPQDDGGEVNIPGGFFSKSPLKRWIVLAAGPAFSALAGILLLIPYFTFHGADEFAEAPVFGILDTGGAAYKAKLDVGDRVVSIDGQPISTFFEMVKIVRDSNAKPLDMVVLHEGKQIHALVKGNLDQKPTPVLNEKFEDSGAPYRIQTKLGAMPSTEAKPLPFGEAVQASVSMPYNGAKGLISLLSHPSEIKDNVGGPGTMIKMTAKSIRKGPWTVIGSAAQISISLGIFNLLPIPPLDGGQMWIAFVEMLRRGKRLSMQTQLRVLNIGFAMVALLIIGVLTIDVGRFTGLSAPPKFTDEKR